MLEDRKEVAKYTSGVGIKSGVGMFSNSRVVDL